MSTGSARVTVTIPTYNRAALLHGAIQSVLGQSFADFELFVSDNASTDDTAAVVASFKDPRIHYLRNDTNIGVPGNLTRCLQLGTAPLWTILPDDDFMLPGNLERKVRIFEERQDVGLVHSATRLIAIGPDGTEYTVTHYEAGEADLIEPSSAVVRRMLTESYSISFQAAVMRRSLVGDEYFSHARDGFADDQNVILRTVHRADAVGYVAEPLVAVRFHDKGNMTQRGGHEFETDAYHVEINGVADLWRVRKRFLAEHGHDLGELPEIWAASRRRIREELLRVVRRKSRSGRSPLTTWRLLREANRVEPLLFTREAMRWLIGSVLGSGQNGLLRRLLGRSARQKAQ